MTKFLLLFAADLHKRETEKGMVGGGWFTESRADVEHQQICQLAIIVAFDVA